MKAFPFSFRMPQFHALRCAALLAAGLVAIAAPRPLHAAAAEPSAPRLEYQVKAGYLFNFLRFAEWPEPPPADAPLRIGVLDDASASAVIAETLAGKMIDRHQIEVVTIEPSKPLAGCHLVFVPRTANAYPPVPPPHGVLIVGERENFAADGGMIGFVIRGYNIRFQVNLGAAHEAGVKLSSRLAGLAEIVRPATP